MLHSRITNSCLALCRGAECIVRPCTDIPLLLLLFRLPLTITFHPFLYRFVSRPCSFLSAPALSLSAGFIFAPRREWARVNASERLTLRVWISLQFIWRTSKEKPPGWLMPRCLRREIGRDLRNWLWRKIMGRNLSPAQAKVWLDERVESFGPYL